MPVIKPVNQKCKLPEFIDATRKKEVRDQVRPIKKKIKYIDTVLAALNSVIVVILCRGNDLFSLNNYESDSGINMLRLVSLLLAIVCFALVSARYYYMLKNIRLIENLEEHQQATFVSSQLWKPYLVEAILNILVIPPGLDFVVKMKQVGKDVFTPADAIIFVISMLRMYSFYPRCLLNHYVDDYSSSSERIVRVCKMNGSDANYMFSLKAQLTLKPYHVFGAVLMASLLVFGLAIRTFENGIDDGQDNYDVSITLWLAIQTLTLTGYGDIVPNTHLGRLMSCVECCFGVMSVALLVSALTHSTEFTPKEDLVYDAVVANQDVKNHKINIMIWLSMWEYSVQGLMDISID